MQVQHHVSLRPYNTFGIDVPAEMFFTVTDAQQPAQLSDPSVSPEKYILGGGSNILLTQPVAGLVLLNRLKGIEQLREDEHAVWLEVQSGEVWHDLVLYALDHNLSGIENLALIPGTVGAAPIQNIGAYGVEACETIESVTGWHWDEQCFITLTNEQCRFGYRDSIFKHELKGKIFITSVTFRLRKQPDFRISYGAIAQELEKMKIVDLSARTIANAVIAIRRSKLPDPAVTGNAGSFFKNPVVSAALFRTLREQYPAMPSYPVSDTTVKVPAGWLIETAGWKGYRNGDVGVHEKQALVLANYGRAGGNDIRRLSEDIISSVQERFGIMLEREVQIW